MTYKSFSFALLCKKKKKVRIPNYKFIQNRLLSSKSKNWTCAFTFSLVVTMSNPTFSPDKHQVVHMTDHNFSQLSHQQKSKTTHSTSCFKGCTTPTYRKL